jgi:hypothetical protein
VTSVFSNQFNPLVIGRPNWFDRHQRESCGIVDGLGASYFRELFGLS